MLKSLSIYHYAMNEVIIFSTKILYPLILMLLFIYFNNDGDDDNNGALLQHLSAYFTKALASIHPKL